MTEKRDYLEGTDCPNCGEVGVPHDDEDGTYLCVSFTDECRVMLYRTDKYE